MAQNCSRKGGCLKCPNHLRDEKPRLKTTSAPGIVWPLLVPNTLRSKKLEEEEEEEEEEVKRQEQETEGKRNARTLC